MVTHGPAPHRTPLDPDSALNRIKHAAEWIGLRWVEESHHHRGVRNGLPEDNGIQRVQGAMIEALVEGHIGYAGTSDLTAEGLERAAASAAALAKATAAQRLSTHCKSLRPPVQGHFVTPRARWLDSLALEALTTELINACRHLKVHEHIETTRAEVTLVDSRTHYLTSDGTAIHQKHAFIYQNFQATARDGGAPQQRSLNGTTARCLQGGLELIDWTRLQPELERTGQEAIELLRAENCPEGTLDLVLAPDQMLLQIHESIGHPLELDRILGDERNYAGWSFVRAEDFGTLQYGSTLMNVVFDPTLESEFASYGFDDGGAPAERQDLIRQGLLVRGLGGLESQARLGVPGVANFRASGWNRAPVDRMANINLEAGDTRFEDLIAGVEQGIFMQSNRSWSIDDYRNKFQFGCEYARLIENGRLTRVVKNPNYRGLTLPFWHSLDAVGDSASFELFGTPYCGKGEPNQMIRVGHAAPACRFRQIEVFGGTP